MKAKTAGLLLGLSVCFSSHAFFITGQMLKNSLEAADRMKQGGNSPQDEKEAQFGRGFVAGVADSALDGNTYCSPADATLGKFYDVTLAYLRAHPEALQKTASTVVLEALVAAYPCVR